MRRLAGVIGAIGTGIIIMASPAGAQTPCGPGYAACPTTTTIVEPATSTTTAPPPSQESAEASTTTPQPGEAVTFTPAPDNEQPPITLDDHIRVILAPINGAMAVQPQVVLVTRSDGTITIQMTVPTNTKSGLYLVAITVLRADGSRHVIITPIVVKPALLAVASVSVPSNPAPGSWFALAQVSNVPAQVRAVQASSSSGGGTTELVRAVLDDGAAISLAGSRLVVSYGEPASSSSGTDGSRPLVAAAAVGLAALGTLGLRRRHTPTISRRTK